MLFVFKLFPVFKQIFKFALRYLSFYNSNHIYRIHTIYRINQESGLGKDSLRKKSAKQSLRFYVKSEISNSSVFTTSVNRATSYFSSAVAMFPVSPPHLVSFLMVKKNTFLLFITAKYVNAVLKKSETTKQMNTILLYLFKIYVLVSIASEKFKK